MIIQGVTLTGTTVIDHPPVVSTGLQQYYDIGNTSSYTGSGASVTDLSGSGYGTGTLVNSPTYTSAGTSSYLSFNGSTSYFYTPNLISMVSGTLNATLEVWVRTASDNGSVVDEQGTLPFNLGWHDSQIAIISGILKGTFWAYNIITGPSVTRNVWQQYVLTYNNSTTTQTLYLNGGNAASNTNARSFGGAALYYAIANGDTTDIGDESGLACDWSIFRVYDRALSAAEVLQNYQADSWRYA